MSNDEARDELAEVGTYGHGGIKLTAYLPSQRVGIEVTAENAVMDWSELFEFVDRIRKPRTVAYVVVDRDGDMIGGKQFANLAGAQAMADEWTEDCKTAGIDWDYRVAAIAELEPSDV